MGSPAGASTNQPGPASVYTPVGQANADQMYQNIVGNLGNFAFNTQATPAGQVLPFATNSVYSNIFNNPGAGQFVGETGAGGQLGLNAFYAANNAGNAIGQAAFDPQQALYNQTLNQTLQQSAAANARSGVAGTPYGQAVTDNALNNFNINWQNQQLNRAISGGEAAQSIYGTGLQNLVGGAGAQFNASNTVGNDALTGATNLANLGNNQYFLAQQTLNDLQSYLNLGQSASQISGNLGNLGQQQLGNSLAGVGSAVGLGSNLLFGSNGIGGATGLLGGGAGLLGSAADVPAMSAADLASVGTGAAVDASGGVAGGGLISGLTSALPFGS